MYINMAKKDNIRPNDKSYRYTWYTLHKVKYKLFFHFFGFKYCQSVQLLTYSYTVYNYTVVQL